MDRWKKAVIHLECMADSESFEERNKRFEQIHKDLNEGKINNIEFSEQISSKNKIFSWGTAVFVKHKDNHYLITARHVLWNEHAASQLAQKESNDLRRLGANPPPELKQSAHERILNQSFDSIFRVPSFAENLLKSRDSAYILNLKTGPQAYNFSTPELDLAVISFKNRGRNFLNEIIRLGHEPISFDEIEDSPSAEGTEVFTVGFPGTISFWV